MLSLLLLRLFSTSIKLCPISSIRGILAYIEKIKNEKKLLPVFLSFALLANGSLTAFAADPVADAVTESDVQTTVSEDQENQEEVTVPEGKTSEEEASTEADDSKETSDVIADIAGRYTELGTNGNPIDGSKAIENAKAGSGVIVDVRTPEDYNKGHIEVLFLHQYLLLMVLLSVPMNLLL